MNVTFNSAEDTDFRVNAIDDVSSLCTEETPSVSSDDAFMDGLHTDAPRLVPDSVQLLSGNQFRRLLHDSERPTAAPKRGVQRRNKTAKPPRQRQQQQGLKPSGGALQAARSIGGSVVEPEALQQELLAAKKEIRFLADELRRAKKRNVQLDESRRRDTREADSLALALSSTSKSAQVKGLLQGNAHLQRKIAGLIEDNSKKTREVESLAVRLAASPASPAASLRGSRGSPLATGNGLATVEDTQQLEGLQKMLHAATREVKAARADRDRVLASSDSSAHDNYCRFVMMKLAFAARTRKLSAAEDKLTTAEKRCEDLATRHAEVERKANEAEVVWAGRVNREKARAESVEGLLRIAQRAADGRTQGSSAWEQMVDSFNAERHDLHRQIKDLEARLAASAEEVGKAARAGDAMRSQTAALFKEDLVARDHEIARLQRELANTASATKHVSADAELAKQKAARLLEDSEASATHKLETHTKVVGKLKAEVASLKQKLAAAKEANRGMAKQLAAQEAKIDSLREAQQQQRLRNRNARVAHDDDDDDDED